MRIIFIGGCQLSFICDILSKKLQGLGCHLIKIDLNEISESDYRSALSQKYDFVFCHPVSELDMEFLYTTKKLVQVFGDIVRVVPDCHFSGYHPIPSRTVDNLGDVTDFGFSTYIPGECVNHILGDGDWKKSVEVFRDPNYFTEEQVMRNMQSCIKDIKNFEKEILGTERVTDIPVSEFIENNYKDKILFHTYDRPSNHLLFFISEKILDILGIEYQSGELESQVTKELLGDDSLPPCFSVRKYLNIKEELKWVLRGEEMNDEEALKYYNRNIATCTYRERDSWIESIKWKYKMVGMPYNLG